MSTNGIVPRTAAEKANDRELTDRGFKRAGKVTPVSFRGVKHKEATYTKHDDLTFGRIPSAIVNGLGAVVTTAATAVTLGKFDGVNKARRKTWKNTKKAFTSGGSFIGGKTLRVAGGLLGTVATAGTINFSKKFRQETWDPAIYGKAEEKLYFSPGNKEREDLSGVQYDPKDKGQIRSYVERLVRENSPKVREVNGHYIVLENGRHGISSFLFVPKGDFSKATSIKFWKAKDGSAITEAAAQWKAISKYCAAYEGISAELDKRVTEMAKGLAAKFNNKQAPGAPRLNLDDPVVMGALKSKVMRKHFKTLVLAKDHVRYYGEIDPHKTNTSSFLTGQFFAYDSATSKAFKEIDGPTMEYKGKLDGEQPFKNRPKQPPVTSATPHVYNGPNNGHGNHGGGRSGYDMSGSDYSSGSSSGSSSDSESDDYSDSGESY